MSEFTLHPRLAEDCFDLGSLGLSRLLMMNDCQYPWFILVPQVEQAREIHLLTRDQRLQLSDESALLAEAMQQLFTPDKLNIAAIGNLVPQLHLHHVARFSHDPAWPAPIWGKFPPQPYAAEQAQLQINRMRTALSSVLI